MKKTEPKCRSCRYRGNFVGGGDNYWACFYILDEGKQRPCGTGSSCTVYKRGKARR